MFSAFQIKSPLFIIIIMLMFIIIINIICDGKEGKLPFSLRFRIFIIQPYIIDKKISVLSEI